MKDVATFIGWWALTIALWGAFGFMVGAEIALAL